MRSCIISCEIVGPFNNGGIGTHCFYLAQFLGRQPGHDVTFLYTGDIKIKDEAYWREWFRRELSVEFVWLSPHTPPERPFAGLTCYNAPTAHKVFHWLRGRKFDVCHFQEMLGHGFRVFQAKRMGLAFQDTVLTCTVHSSWEWIRQAMQSFPGTGQEELLTKYMERYSIEHCDALISPSQYMLDWVKQSGVTVPGEQHVLPYLFDPGVKPVGFRPASDHVIFFGRMETRKGLLVVLDALRELDKRGVFRQCPLRVTLLGKSGDTPDGNGLVTVQKARAALSSAIQLTPRTDLGHHQAMEFLAANNDALVVCPSLVDNSPYAVIESLQLGLNLIASDRGGVPELFESPQRLFAPEPVALADKILEGLGNKLPPPTKRYSPERSGELWKNFCENTVPKIKREKVSPASSQPAAVRVFKASENPAPKLETLLAGNEEFFLFLAEGCHPKPQLAEKLAAAMRFAKLDAATCCAEVAMQAGDVTHLYEPFGACLEGGVYGNVFGCGCVMVRRELLPEVLKDVHRVFSNERLWSFFAELALAGKRCDVLPETLFKLDGGESAFTVGDKAYAAHMETLRCYSRALPHWGDRLLLNTVGHERTIAELSHQIHKLKKEIKSTGKYSLGRTFFKAKRESLRFFSQCQSLGSRAGEATARFWGNLTNGKG